MPRSRGFTRTQRGPTSRRQTGWDEGPLSTTITISAAGATLWTIGQAFLTDGLTVIRLRGSYDLSVFSAAAAGDHFDTIGVGIGIVTAAAFAVGVTAVPSPLTEISWEGWMFHELVCGLRGATAVPEWGTAGGAYHRGVIDSKAMRRGGEDMVIFGCVEAEGEQGTVVVQHEARTRMLLKLP